jgi:hypothetical protein
MSNEWKVEKANYEFGIASFPRLYLDKTQKFKILRLLKYDQDSISAARSTSKSRNSQTAYRIEVLITIGNMTKCSISFSAELQVIFWLKGHQNLEFGNAV